MNKNIKAFISGFLKGWMIISIYCWTNNIWVASFFLCILLLSEIGEINFININN